MEIVREEDKIILRWPRGLGALFGLCLCGGLFISIGTLALITGQFLPGLSSLETFLWTYAVGIPGFLWGLSFIGYKRVLTFSASGLDAYLSRWRFVEWKLTYPPKRIEAIYVEPQRYSQVSRLILQINGQDDFEIARNLPNEEAWQLATMIAEVSAISIRGN